MRPGGASRRGARLAGACAIALMAAVAACQQTAAAAGDERTEAVTGGGGFSDAPLLHPGTFRDTLLPRETLFYAVRLREGERLTVRATVDLRPGSQLSQGARALGGFSLRVYKPLRQQLSLDGRLETSLQDLETDQDAWRTRRVLSPAQATRRAENGDDWEGPGVYHITAAVSAIFRDPGAVVEYPLRLQIDVDDGPGSPAGASGAGPLDAPADSGVPAAATVSRRPPPSSAERGTSAAKTALAVAGGLLFGLLLAGSVVTVLGARSGRFPA